MTAETGQSAITTLTHEFHITSLIAILALGAIAEKVGVPHRTMLGIVAFAIIFGILEVNGFL